jgi:hypothetical protein
VRAERTFQRFTRGQRWEHGLLLLAFSVLLLSGLPQKFRATAWSQHILATPERVELLRTIHHAAAILLILEVLYHLGRAAWLLRRRRLPGAMLPTWGDVREAVAMLRYLLFLTPERPRFGKFNFEQKFTYWFVFRIGHPDFLRPGPVVPLFFTRFAGRHCPGRQVRPQHRSDRAGGSVRLALYHARGAAEPEHVHRPALRRRNAPTAPAGA